MPTMPASPLEWVGTIALGFIAVRVLQWLVQAVAPFLRPLPPLVTVPLTEAEALDILPNAHKFDPMLLEKGDQKTVCMWDPSTMDLLGETPAMDEAQVREAVSRAREAQKKWRHSSFSTRRLLMRTLLRFVTENQESCARVAMRESGKTSLCTMLGEILTTCEKLAWLADYGERCLLPESRASGRMMLLKKVRVEYVPLGVIGAIVPWNYPFHNVFNPISAALFSGNAIVIKVSEFASWSIGYYKRIVDACLDAIGAPRDLVQFVVGFGATGSALVSSGVDKVIFVGSPQVGVIVARTAAATLTPVVLELGGKDPFVVCDDCNVKELVQTACRGVWQNMGQNCAGPERFLVYDKVFDEFCDGVVRVVTRMRTGSALSDPLVDCGAITMGPKQLLAYQRLVDDAVSKGARLLAGGYIPSKAKVTPENREELERMCAGSFYPPTVLADVPEDALVAQEEVFGPLMCIFRVRGNSDEEAVRLANNCDFALSSCVFAGDAARAARVGARLDAGMAAVNDLEGCTYMSQSLPFGGAKKSGYDRFAGPEGLRGLCMVRSICEDRVSFIRNSIPPPMQYPSTGVGHLFAQGLIKLFYSQSLAGTLSGILTLIQHSLFTTKRHSE